MKSIYRVTIAVCMVLTMSANASANSNAFENAKASASAGSIVNANKSENEYVKASTSADANSNAVSVQKKPQKPNIIFIFADDLGYHDVGAYGNQEVRTPNIDKLAKEGLSFTRAYNMGAWMSAVCMPSRIMLNTGQTLWNAKRNREENYDSWLENKKFWSQQLSQAGYSTYFTGKWHVQGVAPDVLFDHVSEGGPTSPNHTKEQYNRPHENEEDPWSPYDPKFGGFWRGDTHLSEVLASEAGQFIEHASKREDPFFMYLAFNAPHDPRQSPKEYVDSYNPKDLKIPENYLPEYPYNSSIGSGRNKRDERLAPFPRTKYAVSVHRQEFYAIISHMDTQIGHILDALKKHNLIENTIIIFTADHGLAVGQHGLLGKQNMYEHSLRVPFIMAGPGIPAGEKTDASIYLQDVVPTTIELAGAEVPEGYQFRSLIPVIRDGASEHYPAIYAAYLQESYRTTIEQQVYDDPGTFNQRAVVEWPYKLILYPNIEKIRMYHLIDDPYEMNDLADDVDSESIIRRLMRRLTQLQHENGDELDLRSIYPDWM